MPALPIACDYINPTGWKITSATGPFQNGSTMLIGVNPQTGNGQVVWFDADNNLAYIPDLPFKSTDGFGVGLTGTVPVTFPGSAPAERTVTIHLSAGKLSGSISDPGKTA